MMHILVTGFRNVGSLYGMVFGLILGCCTISLSLVPVMYDYS